jgi:outer membrane receptor for ferrienterochelin and colicin
MVAGVICMVFVSKIRTSLFLRFLFVSIICFFLVLSSSCLSLATETSEKATLETLMKLSLEELIEVEISLPTRSPMPVHKAPGIATVITAKEIRNMGARNLMDVLKMVPGIGISRNEQGFFMFDVRGISTVSSEKILLMIDGHSLNKNYLGSGLKFVADHLSVKNIRQVEVVRGPGSALYGANAFVAVINIITKDASELEGLEMFLTGGSFSTKKIDVLGGKNFDNGLQVFGSLEWWKTDGPDLWIESDLLAGTPLTMAPGYADTGYEALELLLKVSYKNFNYKGQYIKNDRGVYIGFGNTLTENNTLKYDSFWHELSYRLTVTESLATSFKLYWDQFEQDASVTVLPPGFLGSYPNGVIGGPKVKDRTLGGEVQFNYDISHNNHVLLGFQYEKLKQYDVKSLSNFDPTVSPPAYLGAIQDISSWANWNKNVKREIIAAHIQDEWQVVDTVNLTAGVRYDNYSDFGDTTNPRVGLVWDFIANGELKLLYGQAFRAPSFSELYNDNNTSLVGNPDLKPETIKTYEVGVGYRFTNSLRSDLNYFYNDIGDLIIRDNSTSPAHYANIGGAEINGIEFVITGDYQRDNYWRLFYSYQEPKDADTDARLPFVPNHRAGFSGNYGLTENIISHVDILWTGERPRPAGDPRSAMESYTLVDIAVTVKNIFKNFEIQGTIHNLLNADYSDPDLSGPSQFIPKDYPRAGISALLSLRSRF